MKDNLCELIAGGASKMDACALNDISSESFYNWQQPEVKDEKTGELIKNKQYHSELADAIKKAEAKCKTRNIAIVQRASAGHKLTRTRTLSSGEKVVEEYWEAKPQWTAAGWWLERKYRDEFALRQELTGGDGEKLEPFVIYKPQKLTVEEAEKETRNE